MADGETFDCFLSHNSRDKPAVRALAADLRARGVSMWLDEEQLCPGEPWQRLLENGIRAARSTAVLVGADGLGPWEQEEMRAALTLAVRERRRVIPVLLPAAPTAPELPLFLAERTWVDLRPAVDPGGLSGLDRLVWGITGRRPAGAAPDQAPATGKTDPPAPPAEPARRVSELRRALFLAKSLDEIRRLRNRVKALADEFRSHPDVMDLADDVGQAMAAERPRPSGTRIDPRWIQAGVLTIALIVLGAGLWNLGQLGPRGVPVPALVNLPAPEWIAEWKGTIAGLSDPGAAPVDLRIRIGAARSALELTRRDGNICTATVAVQVVERHARIWTDGAIPCPDGTRLESLALSCREAAGGNADCIGRYAIDRPIRIVLTRVGGGSWPARPERKLAPSRPVPAAQPEIRGQGETVPAGRPSGSVTPAVPAQPLIGAPGTLSPTGSDAKPADMSDAMKRGGQAPEMITVPGGCFLMGSPPEELGRDRDEGPRHQVCLRPFAIGRTEVTFDQYDRFAESTGRKKPDDRGWGRGDRPVINLTWRDAVDYAEWLSAQTGQHYRLPTEAEWEYAARAGTTGPFWTGGCIRMDQANYRGYSDFLGCGAWTGVDRRQTVPAGSLPANPWGLHEVAGNVLEWVQDCWHEGYAGAPTDGNAWLETGDGDCARRVVRGGGWIDYPWRLRSAFRDRSTADEAFSSLGLRLARTL